MRVLKKIIFATSLLIASFVNVKAQNNSNNTNHIDPNSSYKDQIPLSKKHRVKDSFQNKNAEDVSTRNYKQQQRKKEAQRKEAYKQNFYKKDKPDTCNSKHPYGL